MELVLRALNEYDILCNPLKNGLVSKKMLYECTKTYLESIDSLFLESLSKKELEEYVKDNISKYITMHQNNLGRKINKRNKYIRDVINSFYVNKDKESYYLLLYYLSTLNNHLVNGSKVYTEWISTTTNFDCMTKYYDDQLEHKVAVMIVPTNGICNEDTLVVDVSSKEQIKKLQCLSKKINKEDVNKFIELINDDWELKRISNNLFHEYLFNKTDIRFMGYNFSSKSKEISIYNYLDSKYIKSILEQIQVDLIFADIFDINYLLLSSNEQKKELLKFRKILKSRILDNGDSLEKYVYEKLYVENKNINSLGIEKDRVLKIRDNIMRKTLSINSAMIKKY